MTTAIAEYSKTEAALATLSTNYKGVIYDVTTAEGMKAASAGRAELRTYRTSLEKVRQALKVDVLERGRAIDGEAKRITAELESLENPIDEQIKKEEKRREDIRLAAQREVEAKIMEEQRLAKEAEERRIAVERAEIAAQQEALAQAQREQREREVAAQREIEERERAARLRIEDEQREARRLQQVEEDRIRAERKAEQDKIDEAHRVEAERLRAEREAQEATRREVEARERKVREAEEQRLRAERDAAEMAEREARRKENDLIEADAMLASFVTRFGKIEKYAGVVKAIKAVKP